MEEKYKKSVQFTNGTYELMLDHLSDAHFQNQCGCSQDLNFLIHDDWLRDTAVSEHLVHRKGSWEIHLVFAYHLYPLTFRRRLITSQNNMKKAELMANYMRRLAAKDQRGTLRLSLRDLGIHTN